MERRRVNVYYQIFFKLLLVPVWLILTFICLVIGLFVTIYGTGRSIAALILSALFLGVIFCYHDWIQAILLIVIYIFLFAILFIGVAMQAYLEHLRNKVVDLILS